MTNVMGSTVTQEGVANYTSLIKWKLKYVAKNLVRELVANSSLLHVTSNIINNKKTCIMNII